MSEENVEVVRQTFSAWESGDIEASLALFDEEVVINPIVGPTWRGREGVLDMAVDWTEDLADWSMRAELFLDAGDRVVVQVHQTGRGEASGAPVESDYWFVFTVDRDRIVRLDMHAHKAEALEAAGLSE